MQKIMSYSRNTYKTLIWYGVGGLILTLTIMHENPQFTKWDVIVGWLLVAVEFAFSVLAFIIMRKKEKMTVFGSHTREDQTEQEAFFTTFREGYGGYFATSVLAENPKIQNEITQIYRNIIELIHRRLDKLGLRLKFSASRLNYDPEAVEEKTYFDGKYEIAESEEFIEINKEYLKEGSSVHTIQKTRCANYTFIKAKEAGEKRYICPSCGTETTLEDLLDGCDYCGTKFLISDLEKKVANFSLRDDYRMAYEYYRKVRDHLFDNIAAYSFRIVWALMVLCAFFLLLDEPSTDGMFLTWCWVVGMTALFSLCIGWLFVTAYILIVLPIVQIGASIGLYSKKKLKRMKYEKQADEEAEKKVRTFDPLFSLEAFYSDVENKLSTVFFADNAKQMNSFAEGDLSSLLPRYENVVDADVEKMSLTDYRIEGENQVAEVVTSVSLTEIDAKSLHTKKPKMMTRTESIKMRLTKSADCKTQAVCTPILLRCEGCGSSINLIGGMICEYCGKKADIKRYSWVIEEYTV